MRIVISLFAVGALAMVLGPAGYGQFQFKQPGGPGGQGGPGKGGFKFDPNTIFDLMAKGKPAIVIDEVDPRWQGMMKEFAKEKGITNGQLTREQYAEYFEYSRAKRAAGMSGKGPGSNGPTGPGGPGGPNGGQVTLEALHEKADAIFKMQDHNGDGKLNEDEMPGSLKRDLAKWDTNHDGLIDQTEFRAYFVGREQERLARANGNNQGQFFQPPPAAADSQTDEDLDKRPTVYRAGKLPTKGLPPWFVFLDTDKDGQVALYEWRQAGRDLEEFKQWDRDNDGFITPEEALHVQAVLTKSDGNVAGGSPGNFGGGKNFGGGQGGFGGGKMFGGGQGGGGKMFGGGQGGGKMFGGGQGGYGGGQGGFNGGKGNFGGRSQKENRNQQSR
jgi:Ca2+-binding EF-hand superfamily protein